MLTIQECKGFTCPTIPICQINEELDLNDLYPHIIDIRYYHRPKEFCPFNRGNYVIDIILDNGQLFCLKYPLEMTDIQAEWYLEPLFDAVKKIAPANMKWTHQKKKEEG